MEITVEKVDTGVQKLGFQALSTLKTVRVAVYARVSTDQEIQLHSLEEQMKAFRAKIAQHPGWMLVDVYADEGISGTSVKKRKEFLRMMEDCEAGKVDYIMAKSISRFARNTVECLSYVRHLQSIGVQLYFEKEGLDTATSVSELILTVMAAFAQEESRSISENLKWGIRKRFESGESRWTKTYGYRKTKDGEIVIEPDEAAIVRMIFKMYQYGIPMTDILDVVYVNIMFNSDLKRLVVKGCNENDRDALRWCIAKPDKRKSRKMSCRLFSELLYKEMDWSGDCRYKILGYRIEFEGEALYVFDLVAAEVFHECKKKQSADQQPTTVAEENTEEQPVNPRKGYYPDDIAGTFGMPVEQHRQESELRQMDGFVSVGMLTGIPGQQQNL